MQRLFSTFPEGWPGAGLLILAGSSSDSTVSTWDCSTADCTYARTIIPQMVAAGAATLLLIGLWTPVAGVLMAIAELCLTFSHPIDAWTHILIGTLGAALAMLGPGAWSLDARLFGRKRIQIPQR